MKTETARQHRFIILGHPMFTVIKEIKFYNNKRIGLVFYLIDEYLNDIINIRRNLPRNLVIGLVNGEGKINAKVILSNINFLRHKINKLKFNYCNTDIQTLEVVLTYQKELIKSRKVK